MSPPKGNKFWEARSTHGRTPIYTNAEKLWDACCQYFKWVEENPLYEAKAVQGKDGPEIIEVPKMRAMTIPALARFIGVSTRTWHDYSKNDDFICITSKVNEIIRDQKFVGAAAGMLNANIIARDLGLTEKTENTHTMLTHEQWLETLDD